MTKSMNLTQTNLKTKDTTVFTAGNRKPLSSGRLPTFSGFLGPSSFFETDDRKVQKTLLWSFIPAKLWEGLLMLRISPRSFTLMGLYGVSPDTLLHLGLV